MKSKDQVLLVKLHKFLQDIWIKNRKRMKKKKVVSIWVRIVSIAEV